MPPGNRKGSDFPLILEENLRAGRKVTVAGILSNVVMIALKLVGGIWGHSQGLIADAIHSVSDLFTDAVVLLGFEAGRKDADEKHPFGHARIETLTSSVVGLFLIGVALYIGIKASLDIYRHAEYHPTWLAVWIAGMSILLKEVLYRYTIRVGRRIRSPAIVANAWHHRSDALSSVAVLAGLGAARIHPDWHIFDAFAALVVSFLVIKVGVDILRDTIRELTDTAPDPQVLQRIRECAVSVAEVMDIHDLRVRTSGGAYLMEVHVVVDGGLTVTQGHKIAKDVEMCLREEVEELIQVTVHIDPYTADEGTSFEKGSQGGEKK